MANTKGKPVCVVIGATSKWQSDGKMTHMLHGHDVNPNIVPVGVQWGVGGAIAQKFAAEGFFTVVTSRSESNASGLAGAIHDQGGESMIVELDLSSQESIAGAFKTIRTEAGEPEAVIYNAGYSDGRELPAATLGEVYLDHDMAVEALAALREAVQLEPANVRYKKSLATVDATLE